jgi:hypothetical protein
MRELTNTEREFVSGARVVPAPELRPRVIRVRTIGDALRVLSLVFRAPKK